MVKIFNVNMSGIHMHRMRRHVIAYLYETLRRLRLKGVVCSIGSTSFNDAKISFFDGRLYISDLDLIVILTPLSYLRYLVLRKFSKSVKIPTKMHVKEFKLSISYENLRASWLLGQMNYVNLLELRIVDPKTASSSRWLSTKVNVPLSNILELFASCLADLICDCVVNNNTCNTVIEKRLKFLGYIHCLANNPEIVGKFRNRSVCFELLKSSMNDHNAIVKNGGISLLIGYFTNTFIEHVLNKPGSSIHNDGQKAIRDITHVYYRIITTKKSFYKFLAMLKCLYKDEPVELKIFLKHGLELSEFLRLSIFLIAKRIYTSNPLNPAIMRDICRLWTKYMM